jgi:OmpA-OmpF porin, OOP family
MTGCLQDEMKLGRQPICEYLFGEKMKKLFNLVLAISALVTTFAFAQQSVDIKVNTPNSAYVQDGRGIVARDAYGHCWRTGYWTSADALPECEGMIIRIVAKQEPMPVSRPKNMTIDADDLFDFNKATLKPAGKAHLDRLAEDLNGMDLESVTVTGHTDATGSDAYNQVLSERRATAVKAYLVAKGVDSKKIIAKGVGEKQPVADNSTEEGRAKNRRVTIEVVGTAK